MVVRWGRQTSLAVENFVISGEQMPPAIVRAVAMIKAEAAAANGALGVLDDDVADAVARAAEEVLDGLHDDQFPVDVFQTGSGTSTNMNVNEVLAHRASELLGRPVHPNDHVNASQSSNDVVPSALRIAVMSGIARSLVPALDSLRAALEALADRHAATVKLGRTHLMDAVPMTFADEVHGWARMVTLSVARLHACGERVRELPLGGTAVGTGLNAPAGFAPIVIGGLAARTGIEWTEAVDHVEAQSSIDALVECSAALRSTALSLSKVAGDLRLLASGPFGGFAEIRLPELQAGSSIMPGKVNPVIPEVVQQVAAAVVGNDATVVFASTLSTLQLNTAFPVVGRALVSSVGLLSAAVLALDHRCVRLIEVDAVRMRDLAARSPALVTALVPAIGYDAAGRVARWMVEHRSTVTEALVAAGLDPDVIDLDAVARGGT